MRWVLVLACVAAIALGTVFATRPDLLDLSEPEPMTRDERAMFACQTAIKEMIRAPRSFKMLDRGGTLDKGTGEIQGMPTEMTTTVFEFTSENSYGTEIKAIGDCKFAWLIIHGVAGGNPIYIESSVNGRGPDEIATLSIGAKIASLKYPGD